MEWICWIPTIFSKKSAHIAALVLPNEDDLNDPNVEDWYVTELYELCQQKGKHQALKKELPHAGDIPTNIVLSKSNYMKEHHGTDETSKCKIKITGTPNSDPKTFQHNYNTQYFELVTINHVGRTTDARAKKPKPGQNHNAYRTVGDHLEGYGICFHNQDQYRAVQVIFDILLSSEVVADDTSSKSKALDFEKGRHLTPLEQSLEESIASAQTILREMTYMEKRELRMRKTAESINLRVRYFSYLSVSVLLAVTYIQVSYLKRYFHKKKLM